MRHETAIFGPKNPKSRNSSYHFFAFFLFQQQKAPKSPIFMVFEQTLKKRFFQF